MIDILKDGQDRGAVTESAASSRGVLYMLTGDSHAVQLTVSLRSLRQQWQGPVAIAVGDVRAWNAVERVLKDQRAHGTGGQTFAVHWSAPLGRNLGYANKTFLPALSPFDSTAFIDADTIVTGDIEPIFPREDEIVLTQFADWTTSGRRIRSRIEQWRDVVPDRVTKTLSHSPALPGINTGVMGFTKRALASGGFADDWRDVCHKRLSFICDEIAAQIIFVDHPHRMLDDRFNASVVYSYRRLAGSADVRVWHGHGSKFYRKDTGQAIYYPWFEATRAENFGGVADWMPLADSDLAKYLRDQERAGGK